MVLYRLLGKTGVDVALGAEQLEYTRFKLERNTLVFRTIRWRSQMNQCSIYIRRSGGTQIVERGRDT